MTQQPNKTSDDQLARTAKTTLLGKWKFLEQIMEDHGLTPSTKIVAARLLMHHNIKTNRCFASAQKLADRLGVNRDTVTEAIRQLKEGAWLETHQPSRREANEYTFKWDRVAGVSVISSRRKNRFEVTEVSVRDAGNSGSRCRDFPTPIEEVIGEQIGESNTAKVGVCGGEFAENSFTESSNHTLSHTNRESASSPNLHVEAGTAAEESIKNSEPISLPHADTKNAVEESNIISFPHSPSDHIPVSQEFQGSAPDTVSPGAIRSADFDRYLAECSNHYFSKDDAHAAWEGEINAGANPDEMIAARHNYEKTARGKEQRYIKRPDTFLHDGFWVGYRVHIVTTATIKPDSAIEEAQRRSREASDRASRARMKKMGDTDAEIAEHFAALEKLRQEQDPEVRPALMNGEDFEQWMSLE
jgi:Helix-turn-helix domain